MQELLHGGQYTSTVGAPVSQKPGSQLVRAAVVAGFSLFSAAALRRATGLQEARARLMKPPECTNFIQQASNIIIMTQGKIFL